MTFDPNIPTHITFPLVQGISTPHMNLVRLCVKKIWMTPKMCTKNLTHWLTNTQSMQPLRSFLMDYLKMINCWQFLAIYCPNSYLFLPKICILIFFFLNLNNELKRGHENEVRAGDGKLKINFARNSKEEGWGCRKKCACSVPVGAGAQTWDLPHARWESVAARHK